MTPERIAQLRAGGHSVLAHKYNDLAECPVCTPTTEACGEEHLIGAKPESCFACLAEQRDELLAALKALRAEAHGFLAMADENAHGITNMRVLRHWIDNAHTVIAKAEGGRTTANAPKPSVKASPCGR